MKYIIIFSSLVLLACNNPQNSITTNNVNADTTSSVDTIKALGGDRDEHGCIPSAGQTWSSLKAACIQVYNIGTRINPAKTDPNEAIISAFAVYNSDSTKVEIFLPNEPSTIILDLNSTGIYGKDTLIYDAQKGNLNIHDSVTYTKELQ